MLAIPVIEEHVRGRAHRRVDRPGGGRREHRLELPGERVVVLGEQLLEHLLLAGEVAVEGAVGDAGRRGDVGDVGGREAALAEAAPRRLAHGLAGPRLLLPAAQPVGEI